MLRQTLPSQNKSQQNTAELRHYYSGHIYANPSQSSTGPDCSKAILILTTQRPLPRYAKPLFTLPMQTPLRQSMPFRYNSVYLISNLRLCFAYHNYIHPCRSLFGNFSPCVSAFPRVAPLANAVVSSIIKPVNYVFHERIIKYPDCKFYC